MKEKYSGFMDGILMEPRQKTTNKGRHIILSLCDHLKVVKWEFHITELNY